MTHREGRERRTLEVAEKIREILADHRVESAVIGAMALAVHGYVRVTRNFDLGTDRAAGREHVVDADGNQRSVGNLPRTVLGVCGAADAHHVRKAGPFSQVGELRALSHVDRPLREAEGNGE